MSKTGFNHKSDDIPNLAVFGLCNNDRYVYIFGGRNCGGKIGLRNCLYYNDLWEYNIELNTIKCMRVIDDEKPDRRSAMTLNYYDDNLYLFGGYTSRRTRTNDIWTFSMEMRFWNPCLHITNQKPHERSDHKSIMYKHYLIIFGGVLKNLNQLNECHLNAFFHCIRQI